MVSPPAFTRIRRGDGSISSNLFGFSTNPGAGLGLSCVAIVSSHLLRVLHAMIGGMLRKAMRWVQRATEACNTGRMLRLWALLRCRVWQVRNPPR